MTPTLTDIRAAAERIRPYIHRTPVFTCATIDEITGARVFLKCENLQKVGAFKFRGACNAVFSLSEAEAARGVCTHSSGNHAQALALAARIRSIPAYIVMPENAPVVKKAAVAGYGGQITFCLPTLQARESTLAEIAARSGAVEIHPYNNERIIAGAGTAALELLSDHPDLDVVMAPVGGGGLISGTALTSRGLKPGVRVMAAEPKNADDAYRSFQVGRILPSESPKTIADGLLTSLGSLTFPIIRDNVEQILTVSEESILRAMRLLWERAKLVIEPSGAVPLGAMLEHPRVFSGLQVGLILSGGNVDLDRLPWIKSGTS
jgi:threonine dehydratase